MLSTKFYHPAHLLYKVSHFGDVQTFEDACIRGRSQGTCFPDLQWDAYIPSALIPLWNILLEWDISKPWASHLRNEDERALLPIITYLHEAAIPFRPIRLHEVLTDVELYQGFRFTPVPTDYGTLASIAGNSFIHSIVQRFVATTDNSLPYAGPATLERLIQLYQQIHAAAVRNLAQELQAGRLTQAQVDFAKQHMHSNPLPAQLLDHAFWHSIQQAPVAKPEILSSFVPHCDWKSLAALHLGGVGAHVIWEAKPFLQQLLQQWNRPLSAVVQSVFAPEDGAVGNVAIVSVEQLFALFDSSGLIRSISVADTCQDYRATLATLYIRYLVVLLSQAPTSLRSRRVVIYHEAGEIMQVLHLIPQRADVTETLGIVLPGTVPHPVLLQRVHAQPPADILFGNPYLPVEVSLSSFEYEAIVSHTDSPLSVVLQVDWRQGVAQCLIGVGQRAPVELATLPLAQAVLVALLHRLGGAFIPEVFWNSTVGDMQPEADFLQLLHTAFDAAFPREAVVSLYQATWHEARAPTFSVKKQLPHTQQPMKAKHVALFRIQHSDTYDAAYVILTGSGQAVAGRTACLGG